MSEIKILHLEDEHINRITVSRALKKAGLDVSITPFTSARDAIQAIAPEGSDAPLYNLLLLDVHVADTDRAQPAFSRLDGYSVADVALQRGYAPEQIIFSSDTPDAQRQFDGIPMTDKVTALQRVIQAVQGLIAH